jgi:hypothetical protein
MNFGDRLPLNASFLEILRLPLPAVAMTFQFDRDCEHGILGVIYIFSLPVVLL